MYQWINFNIYITICKWWHDLKCSLLRYYIDCRSATGVLKWPNLPRCRQRSMPTCSCQQHTSHGWENFRHNGKITGCENATARLRTSWSWCCKKALPKVKISFASVIFCVESPRIKYDLRIIVQIRLYILNLELISQCEIKLATKKWQKNHVPKHTSLTRFHYTATTVSPWRDLTVMFVALNFASLRRQVFKLFHQLPSSKDDVSWKINHQILHPTYQ